MTEFIIAYHGGKKPETPEAGASAMADWQNWLKNLGDAVVNPGMPMGNNKMVSADAVTDVSGAAALTGFTIVEAADMDAAVAMAQDCPFLIMGDLQVAQIFKMG